MPGTPRAGEDLPFVMYDTTNDGIGRFGLRAQSVADGKVSSTKWLPPVVSGTYAKYANLAYPSFGC